MGRGKTLRLFLMDGEPTGRIKCSIANWTGIAYKIPRTELRRCTEMDVLKQSGVYFLFGTDDEDRAIVYVGQAGSRKNRVASPYSGSTPIHRILDRSCDVYHKQQLLWTDRDQLSGEPFL